MYHVVGGRVSRAVVNPTYQGPKTVLIDIEVNGQPVEATVRTAESNRVEIEGKTWDGEVLVDELLEVLAVLGVHLGHHDLALHDGGGLDDLGRLGLTDFRRRHIDEFGVVLDIHELELEVVHPAYDAAIEDADDVRVIERGGRPVDEDALRDTVLVERDNDVTVAFVADNPGKWMLHCHMLEHEDDGMMGQFEVVAES